MKDIIKKLDIEIDYNTDLKKEFDILMDQVMSNFSEEITKLEKRKNEAEVKKAKLLYTYVLKNQLNILLELDVYICVDLFNRLDNFFLKVECSFENKSELKTLDDDIIDDFQDIMEKIHHNLYYIRDYTSKKYMDSLEIEEKRKKRVKEFYDLLSALEEKLKKEI